MAYAKTQKEATYRVGLKRKLRKKGIKGWRKDSPTSKLESRLGKKKKKKK